MHREVEHFFLVSNFQLTLNSISLACSGCQVISMGCGQESHARRVVTQTMVDGGWVVLQNGHFCTDYLMEALAQITLSDAVHSGFRFWVTSESSNQFPANFLQVW